MPAWQREFQVFVDSINAEASKQIAAAARQGQADIVAQESARRGIQPGVTGVVDGTRGKDFDQVRPDGQIVLLFDYFPEIAAALFAELKARSPKGPTGAYESKHFAMVDGQPLAPLTLPQRDVAKDAQQMVITNPMRYARRLEVGKTEGGGTYIKNAKPYIFESAMQAVRREFRNVANFDFTYIDLPEGEQAYTTRKTAPKRKAKRSRQHGAYTIQFPAITVDRADY